MALDKIVDSTELDSGLTTIANAIRTKGGTSARLSFPSGMVTAINDITAGGGGAYDITATDNGDGTQSLAIVDASGATTPFNAIVEDITITANCTLGDAVRTEVEAFVLANGRTIADVACAVFQYKGAGREQNRVMSCLFFNYNGDGTWDTPVEMARYRDGAVQYQPMSSSYAGIMNAGDVYQMVLALNPTV